MKQLNNDEAVIVCGAFLCKCITGNNSVSTAQLREGKGANEISCFEFCCQDEWSGGFEVYGKLGRREYSNDCYTMDTLMHSFSTPTSYPTSECDCCVIS